MTTAKGSWRKWAAVAAALAAAASAYFVIPWRGGSGSKTASPSGAQDASSASTPGPVVPVKTVPLKEATITETIKAYGAVVSQFGDLEAVSLPFEARVTRMRVTPGQRVAAGDTLLDAEPTSATFLQLREARNAVEAAAKQLQQIERRYAQKLATNQELFTSQADLRSAEAKLDNLEWEGVSSAQRLKAALPGIVNKVDVQIGQTVPAGTPMVEVAADRHIEALLGVEPESVQGLRPGQLVRLSPVHSGSPGDLLGKIRLIAQRVNPSTRLVDVFVAIPPKAKLLLGAYVEGILTIASKRALIAPREAALPEGGRHSLFTVKDDRAVKHVVSLGLENDDEVEVVGSGLAAGAPIVVSGNYELQDGMAVKVEQISPGARSRAAPPTPGTAP